uniref:Uncharacterized protein n=1 Tax=Arundo donax TaxID=35708 RepID=A0A0A9EVR7_ARUDO
MRRPKRTVMSGSAAPLAIAPSAPTTMSAASAPSANANSLWNGTLPPAPLPRGPGFLPLASPAPPDDDGAFSSNALLDSDMTLDLHGKPQPRPRLTAGQTRTYLSDKVVECRHCRAESRGSVSRDQAQKSQSKNSL